MAEGPGRGSCFFGGYPLRVAGSLEREEGCPLSLACGQTAPPEGEPSGDGVLLSLLPKRAVRSPSKLTCLSLWERWHGEAVTERVPSKAGYFRRMEGDSPRKGDAAALSGKATKSGAEPLPYKVSYRYARGSVRSPLRFWEN